MRVIGSFVTGSPGWDFSIRSNGKLIMFLSGSGSTSSLLQSVSTEAVPADSQFHLVAATVDRAANDASLFIDGVEVSYDEKNTVENFDSTTSIASSAPMTVGSRSDGLNPYNGSIDELETFDRVLTGGEVQAIFDADAAGKCKDEDGDGFRPPDDCDETDATINPDGIELPGNFVDENCDGNLGECDPCFTWRNHGEYVRCVAHDAEALVASGDISQEKADQLVSDAAKSDIGKKGSPAPPECL